MIAGHYIAGEWLTDGPTAESLNPADGSAVGRYAPGSRAVADEAAAAARAAFDATPWSASPRQRAAALLEFADRLEAELDTVADLVVRENGKLRAEALGETRAAISEARYYAGLARTILGRTIEPTPGTLSIMTREAAGVAAIIVPWNAPVTLLVRSLAPALAAGCTTVIKPAAQTPLVHAALMRILASCPSLPAGIVNSVNENGSEVGEALVASRDVDVISFTGSSATGKKIMAAAAPTLKRLSLELGGKAPSVVFDDADLDLAVRELTRGSLVMAGQICVAATRFLVHEPIRAAFEERITAAWRAIRVGPGDDPTSQMGALIDKSAETRLHGVIARAESEGEIILRGDNPGGRDAPGAFLTPTLFRISDTTSPLVQEELFGPIASVETFADEAEAVAMANATDYGLAASVYTRDLHRALRASRAIRAGTVWLNCHGRLFAEGETGGFRQSGLGRLHGPEGLDDFLETKHVYIEQGVL